MSMMKEFKEFAMKGNLVDIAVGFVMGAAFTRLVTAFTGGIVTPLISMLTGDVKFDNLKWVIKSGVAEVKDAAGAVTVPAIEELAVKYGEFLQATMDFIIVAFVMFMVVKAVNSMKKKEEAAPPAGPTDDQKLLMEIRDALKR
jgi:large conductance mechanosensitive channel